VRADHLVLAPVVAALLGGRKAEAFEPAELDLVGAGDRTTRLDPFGDLRRGRGIGLRSGGGGDEGRNNQPRSCKIIYQKVGTS